MNYIDLHADTLTGIPEGESLWENGCDIDLKRASKVADKYTQVFALWKDRAKVPEGQQEQVFMGLYHRALERMEEQREHLVWCRSGADMERAHQSGRAAAFLSVEDISLSGSLAERVGELGIRFAMLTWNYDNEYACGAAADQTRGLTAAGVELVNELLRQRVVLDISHLSDAGVEQIFALTGQPLIASHSDVRKISNQPRNLKDAYIRELIRRKGLIGMNFFRPFVGYRAGNAIRVGDAADDRSTIPDLLRHMDAVLELGGEDVLAFGADFDGCGGAFSEGITGIESMPRIREEMRKAGFGEQLTDKIFFENARRFIMENVVTA